VEEIMGEIVGELVRVDVGEVMWGRVGDGVAVKVGKEVGEDDEDVVRAALTALRASVLLAAMSAKRRNFSPKSTSEISIVVLSELMRVWVMRAPFSITKPMVFCLAANIDRTCPSVRGLLAGQPLEGVGG
jgi:hypothetical protein